MNFLETNNTGGFPLRMDDFRFIQNAWREGFEGLAKLFGVNAEDYFLLTTPEVSGSNYSEFYVAYAGEIWKHAGGIIPTPGLGESVYVQFNIAGDGGVESTEPFGDAVAKEKYFNRTATFVTAITGSLSLSYDPGVTEAQDGDGILLSELQNRSFKGLLVNSLENSINTINSEWTEMIYDPLNLDATSGTWTVSNANDFKVKYKVIGKTVFFNFRVVNSSLSSTPASVRLRLPSGMTIKTVGGFQWNSIGQYNNNNDSPTTNVIRIEATAGENELFLSKLTGSHVAITGGFDVIGQIIFEIN